MVIATCLIVPAILGGVRIARGRQQRVAIEKLLAIEGCQIAYDGEPLWNSYLERDGWPSSKKARDRMSFVATAAEAVLGPDACQRCGTVAFPCDRIVDVLPHLRDLPYLRRAVVRRPDEDSEAVTKQVEVACQILRDNLYLESLDVEFSFRIDAPP